MKRTIITLYNVCAVPWGVLSTVGGYHEYREGDIMSTVGDILSTVGDIMINVGDILSTVGVILSTVGGVQDPGGISSCTWSDILSTVEGVQYREGKNLLLFEYPTVLMISPHMYHDIPHGTQISKDDIPPRYS